MARKSIHSGIGASTALLSFFMLTSIAFAQAVPTCDGKTATIYVLDGKIVGGPDNGQPYTGTLRGTDGDDVMVGTSASDQILGGNGNDTICAGPGDDSVVGGAGNDVIKAGPGDDSVQGGPGSDRIEGGSGDDTIQGD